MLSSIKVSPLAIPVVVSPVVLIKISALKRLAKNVRNSSNQKSKDYV